MLLKSEQENGRLSIRQTITVTMHIFTSHQSLTLITHYVMTLIKMAPNTHACMYPCTHPQTNASTQTVIKVDYAMLSLCD